MAITFRPQSDSVEENFEKLKESCRNVTGREGGNAALNYAVNLASAYLESENKKIQTAKRKKIKAGEFAE